MKKIKLTQLEDHQLSEKRMQEIAGGLHTCPCTLYEWGADTATNVQDYPPGLGPGPGGPGNPEGPTCICFSFGSPGAFGDAANDDLSV